MPQESQLTNFLERSRTMNKPAMEALENKLRLQLTQATTRANADKLRFEYGLVKFRLDKQNDD
jgi:hypothetical protein